MDSSGVWFRLTTSLKRFTVYDSLQILRYQTGITVTRNSGVCKELDLQFRSQILKIQGQKNAFFLVYSPKPGYLPGVLRDMPPLNDKEYIDVNYSSINTVKPYSLPPVRFMKKRVVYWIVEYEPLLDSCDMTFDDWIRIATDIRKAYHNYDGFVVLHGTDTLAYTASALSFMMENLGKPVIITGSQIPVAEVRSDGMENLIGALITAGNFDIPEVYSI